MNVKRVLIVSIPLFSLSGCSIVAVLYDLWTRGRVHPALIWGGAAVVLQPLLLVVADTRAGLALADLFR